MTPILLHVNGNPSPSSTSQGGIYGASAGGWRMEVLPGLALTLSVLLPWAARGQPRGAHLPLWEGPGAGLQVTLGSTTSSSVGVGPQTDAPLPWSSVSSFVKRTVYENVTGWLHTSWIKHKIKR